MHDRRFPERHPDPEVDLIRPYITSVVGALLTVDVGVATSWLDPQAPRDATVRLTDGHALVWDEDHGWRYGTFVSGRQGVRTRLAAPVALGANVLVGPATLADEIAGRLYRNVSRRVLTAV